MNFEFGEKKWKKINDTFTAWWEHRLNRPIIPVNLVGRDPGRPEPSIPKITQKNAWNMSYSADQIIDRFDYDLSTVEYLSDSFPRVDMYCTGPCILAAFLGAEPKTKGENVWFEAEKKELKELHFEYDPENRWYQRIREIYQAAPVL